MDYLQYLNEVQPKIISKGGSFKPYYKWITFNIKGQFFQPMALIMKF